MSGARRLLAWTGAGAATVAVAGGGAVSVGGASAGAGGAAGAGAGAGGAGVAVWARTGEAEKQARTARQTDVVRFMHFTGGA
jgi:hypothetical protein